MRFRAIDTFRGLAAIVVILFHIPDSVITAGNQFIGNAYVMVDFFFVLSGFVITHSYLSKVNDRKSLRSFATRRFMRIYPLHIFTLLVFLAFETSRYAVNEFFFPLNTPPFKDCSFATLIGNLTMTHSLGFYDHLSWNIPSWSISVEFYVYMFWALSIYIFRKNLLIIGAILFPFICWFIISHEGNLEYTFNYGFIRCLYGFFIGVFAYQLSARVKIPGYKAATILEIVVMGASLYFIYAVTHPVHWLMAPWFAVLVILFSKEAGFLSSGILSNSRMTFLGDLSFSYYLNHVVIIRAFDLLFYKVFKLSHGIAVDLALIAVVLVTTHIVSLFTYKYIEMAFYNRKKKALIAQPELALTTVPATHS